MGTGVGKERRLSRKRAYRGPVVITGTSTGIGASTAMHLTDLGFHVFAGVRREADGEALQAKASGTLSAPTARADRRRGGARGFRRGSRDGMGGRLGASLRARQAAMS